MSGRAVIAAVVPRCGNVAAGGGAGDVTGPSSATDNHIALFDGADGTLLKDGGYAMPTTPGTTGQALRVNAAGDAEWALHWVVNPTDGRMSSTLPSVAVTETLVDAQTTAYPDIETITQPLSGLLVSATFRRGLTGNVSFETTASADIPLGGTIAPQKGIGNVRIITANKLLPGSPSVAEQSGRNNFQHGNCNVQSGGFSNAQIATAYSTQSGYYNVQMGSDLHQNGGSGNAQFGGSSTQSGNYLAVQFGANHTQSGSYAFQSGSLCTQSGKLGFQHGEYLNDGGFAGVIMLGSTKTATVASRAYFALDNGIWLKPVAVAPAAPENGVIYYDNTTHKFRGYANGAWVDFH